MVKIPEIVSPIPTPKFGDFRGFFPKYPQNFGVPRPQRIPNIPSPVPTPKFGDFRGFSPQKTPNLEFPHPQSVPEHSKSCNPVPIPEIWGFSGINPNKSPNFGLSQSPKYPRSVFKPCPCPYSFPQQRGGDGDKWGLGPFCQHYCHLYLCDCP